MLLLLAAPALPAGCGGDGDSNDQDNQDPVLETGETCETAFVLSWAGSTLVRNGDSRVFADDYQFEGCSDGQYWIYPNADVVYRLDFPPGQYRVTLTHDLPWSLLSLIEVKTDGSCGGFAAACTNLVDSDTGLRILRHAFTVEAGQTTYFVVDSSYDSSMVDADTTEAPYVLTFEEFSLLSIGDTCARDVDCADDMPCFDVDDDGAGYCTESCALVSCDSGSIPMSCRDIGDSIYYDEGTEACVADAEIGSLSESDACEYNYLCEPGICVLAWSAWYGECRIPCTTTCTTPNSTCVDITDDLLEPPVGGSVKVCAADSEVDSIPVNGDCLYSYQCAGAATCAGAGCTEN